MLRVERLEKILEIVEMCIRDRERVEYGAGKHSGKGAEIDDELFEMAQDFFDAALEYGLQKHVEHDNHGKHTKNHEAQTAGKAAENTCSEGAERDNDKFDEGAYARVHD